MATLEEYISVAPLVMSTGNFTINNVENKLSQIPDPPDPPVAPNITQQKVVAIFNTVFDMYDADLGVAAAGGYGALALEHDLWPSQVRQIVSEMKAMHQLYLGN